MLQNGIYVNLGDLLNSFTEDGESTFKQVSEALDYVETNCINEEQEQTNEQEMMF